ncbi:MerR family transcriptional regulator [Paraclostridium sordellii]|uniref:MerR family transcriptional regulator n=1 Tax=Paraclostridium sordellii TaxID=1505 RepID=UPI0005DB65C4|nr:MerR family transcriptional regulator [Paeniclostridium sordellii]CEO26200.1 transcriptional activator TipA [[Clostridium] sordellii] [Paeniclostridium sordellii]
MYKVNEISKLTGVSIRMLHHYDKIGLLVPSEKTEKNYRLYSDEDIKKLYQILIFKELEFPLKEIKSILESSDFDRKEALKLQKDLMIKKKKRMDEIIQSISEVINNLEGDKKMSKKNFNVFNYEKVKEHQKKYEHETKAKYEKTNAYEECSKKTSNYSENDWKKICEEANCIYNELAKLMDRKPEDKEVQDLVEKWRNHITDNYYECTIDIFRGLGIMYVADNRFKKNIDKTKDGLAEFLSEAIKIYCDKFSTI